MGLIKASVLSMVWSTFLFGYSFSTEGRSALQVSAIKSKKSIIARIEFTNEFGVQKDAPNRMRLIRLRKGHEIQKNLKKKMLNYGKVIKTIKKFSGYASSKDKEYLAYINNVIFELRAPKSDYLLEYTIFYCSFTKGLCSTQKKIIQILTSLKFI